jgi:N4-(beta-N-acetylglucosaminyl)-L-asparaginase
MTVSRRDFLTTAVVGSLSLGLHGQQSQGQASKEHPANKTEPNSGRGKRPIMVCANNGFNYLDDAYAFLAGGGDTLDAALRVVKGPEDDPHDTSVGLGGLPNEEGVVELDACCMHGPTRRAGSVGGVRNIKNVSLVSKAVMEHTGHVMLVGEGAERFAVAVGFPRENLLTDHSRKIWLLWKEYHSSEDWWGPGLADPHWQPPDTKPQSDLIQERFRRLEERAADLGIAPELRADAVHKVLFPPTGTIHCSALNEKGEISGCTTTSGLAWKLPGRCGDSPIIGAGCYTDQDVGSAGATGSGEENIKVAGAHTIVENMRRGMSPLDAAQRRRLCRRVAVGRLHAREAAPDRNTRRDQAIREDSCAAHRTLARIPAGSQGSGG